MIPVVDSAPLVAFCASSENGAGAAGETAEEEQQRQQHQDHHYVQNRQKLFHHLQKFGLSKHSSVMLKKFVENWLVSDCKKNKKTNGFYSL